MCEESLSRANSDEMDDRLGTWDMAYPGCLLSNASAGTGDDDNLARKVGDVLLVWKGKLGRATARVHS